jgi:hypothetical protein
LVVITSISCIEATIIQGDQPVTPAEFSSEGRQYIVPGTECPKRQTFKTEGKQLVVPGADRISMRQHMERLMLKPIKPRRRQVGLGGTGLFGKG